jgi:tetratricopeptide (TPR) repeat protein
MKFLLFFIILLAPKEIYSQRFIKSPEIQTSYQNKLTFYGKKIFTKLCITCHNKDTKQEFHLRSLFSNISKLSIHIDNCLNTRAKFINTSLESKEVLALKNYIISKYLIGESIKDTEPTENRELASLGIQHYINGNYEDAISTLTLLIEKAHDKKYKLKAYQILGVINYILGNKEQAINYFNNVFRLNARENLSSDDFSEKIVDFYNDLKIKYRLEKEE